MGHGNRATDGSGLQRLAFVVLVCFVSDLALVPSASAEQLNEARLNQLAARVATSRRELTSLRRTLEQQERADCRGAKCIQTGGIQAPLGATVIAVGS